jgi:hypothetical protein
MLQFHPNVSSSIRQRIYRAIDTGALISKEEWMELRANSWDRAAILPYMEDDAVIAATEVILRNCPVDGVSVHGVLSGQLVPELIRRLSKKEQMT